MKQVLYLFTICLLLFSCKKDSNKQEPIDVSEQWIVDGLGNLFFGYADGQWQSKTFTAQEQALFNSLDTANLAGTTQPGTVFETTLNYNSPYPNPFVSAGHMMHFQFTSGFSGQVVLKMVYVDSLMVPHFKTAIRLHVNALPPPVPSAIDGILVQPIIPVGRFRLYYTLSAQNSPHFYRCWGNVQKRQ